jgi:RecG-like helicase
MNRLLQGDVGSGKTIVAVLSILLAIDNGFQATLMAPTEILANQHYIAVSELLEGMNIKVEILTGSTKTKKKKNNSSKFRRWNFAYFNWYTCFIRRQSEISKSWNCNY